MPDLNVKSFPAGPLQMSYQERTPQETLTPYPVGMIAEQMVPPIPARSGFHPVGARVDVTAPMLNGLAGGIRPDPLAQIAQDPSAGRRTP